jgi:ribonuclease T1
VYARRLVLAVTCAALSFLGGAGAHARAPAPLTDVALSELPAEARATYARILSGGPFAYDRDGVVFGNRERLLPERPRGYYHEYTVPTPGAHNRGAQRIVCGGRTKAPDACFYTGDHYRSFQRIRS